MKKTLTVNLNNTVYHIDEDAYRQLQDYLESLNDYFRNEEGASEILSDIEARIAELFKERMRFGMQIITVREVDEIISVMGHPEDFASDTLNIETDDKEVGEKEVENQDTEKGEDGTTPQEKIPERNRRRLFRDKDDAFLGGVASGLGYYLGVSTALIRILFVLFTFLTGYALLIYLVLWICIPEAKTAAQKLEMRGEAATIDNIKRFGMSRFCFAGSFVFFIVCAIGGGRRHSRDCYARHRSVFYADVLCRSLSVDVDCRFVGIAGHSGICRIENGFRACI